MRLMNWLIVLAAFALAAAGPFPRLLPEAIRPDLFILPALFTAARAPRHEALPLCWGIGLCKDLLSAGPLGLYAMLYLAFALVVVALREFLDMRVALSVGILALAGAFFTDVVALSVLAIHGGVRPPARMVGGLATAALVTGAFSPLVMHGLGKLGGWLGVRRKRPMWTAG